MGLCILSAISADAVSIWSAALGWVVVILQVSVGVGFVIFVHELGHFLVAKACGVKCEKFYLGFDINGWRFARFRWGETEYGIGVLPLGGYVKMLGQDDNPARAAEERERTVAAKAAGEAAHDDDPGDRATGSTALATATRPASSTEASVAGAGDSADAPLSVDPRSYTAKSVPQRMAIISAGVVMNLIFAVLMAALAFKLGVMEQTCGASLVFPGEVAWQSDIEPGDRVVAIGHDSPKRELRFTDLMIAVTYSTASAGVDFEIARDGVPEPFWVNVKPNKHDKRLAPMIGVLGPMSLALDDKYPVDLVGAASRTGKFRGGDRIVAINDKPMQDYRDFIEMLAQHPGDTLSVRVRHKPSGDEGGKDASGGSELMGEEETILVPPQPLRTLGLEMKMGPIAAVQANSPAAKAGLQQDDFIISIGGEGVGDTATLAERLRRRAGKTLMFAIQRDSADSKSEPIEKTVTLREPKWYELCLLPGSPLSAPALGAAYRALNRINTIEPGGPAAGATLEKDGKPATPEHFVPDDEIVMAEVILPADKEESDEFKGLTRKVEFGEKQANWPMFLQLLQALPKGSKVRLTLADERSAVVEPVESQEWFNPERGFNLSPDRREVRAADWGEALHWGARETKTSALAVYSFLRAVGSGRISAKGVSGPVGVAKQAAYAAQDSFSRFLLFLTMLSANLAVVNFLPIPVLDGGHMVFLTLEAILRRPVSERVVVAFQYFGLLLILALMVFALLLDTELISRFS